MKPALQKLIRETAEQCVAAADECLLTSNAIKKSEAAITALVDKIAADATLTDPK